MIITDEVLTALGIDPMLFDESQRERIEDYYKKIKKGTSPISLYSSLKHMDNTVAEIQKNCIVAKAKIQAHLNDTLSDIDAIFNFCKDNSNLFGSIKSSESLDKILVLSAQRIQDIHKQISDALELVNVLYSSFTSLTEQRNDYRLLVIEASLVFYAEKLNNIETDNYKKKLYEINVSLKKLINLEDSLYKSASTYEQLLEFRFMSTLDKLAESFDFYSDGKHIELNRIFSLLNDARIIIFEAQNV